MTCGRRPIRETRIEKARGRFPGAGFGNSCDDENMPVICPTCQMSSLRRPMAGVQAGSIQTPEPVAARLSWPEAATS